MRRSILLTILIGLTSHLHSQTQSSLEIFEAVDENYSSVHISEVHVAVNGDRFFGGSFKGTLDFDSGDGVAEITTENNDTWTFILKQNSSGEFQWVKTFDKAGQNLMLEQLRTDQLGNVYIAGTFQQTQDFDPGEEEYELTQQSLEDVFLLKLDQEGNFSMAFKIGDSGRQLVSSLEVVNENEIYLTGNWDEECTVYPFVGFPISFPECEWYEECDNDYSYVLKFSGSGEIEWFITPISKDEDTYSELQESTVDEENNLILCGFGSSQGDYDPGPETHTLQEAPAFFIQKLSPQGNLLDLITFDNHTQGLTKIVDIELDAFGNAFISGNFNGDTIDLDPGPEEWLATGPGFSDSFVLKLDENGNFLWANEYKSTNGWPLPGTFSWDKIYLQDLAVSSTGELFITGFHDYGEADLDPGLPVLLGGGYNESFIQKLDTDGNMIWNLSGYSKISRYLELEITATENLIVAGSYDDSLSFTPTLGLENTSAGDNSTFILDLQTLGSCNDLSIVTDSLKHIDCLSNGFVNLYGINGNPPYEYSWIPEPDSSGMHSVFSLPGQYQLTVTDSDNCSIQRNFNIEGPSNTAAFEFEANLISHNYRPGTFSIVWIDAFALGCELTSGEIILFFDSLVTPTFFEIEPDILTSDSAVWMFQNLNYDSENIQFYLELLTDTTATIGDTICLGLELNNSAVTAFHNFSYEYYCFPVENSYDPNDKRVAPDGLCRERYVSPEQQLDYTIRFQNTGTAKAFKVEILDTISKFLEIQTLNVVGSSHEYEVEILSDSLVQFVFNDINLPDSLSNPLLSNGYIVYTIKPKSNVADGSVLSTPANIYFDYNPPITTNAPLSTVHSDPPPCELAENAFFDSESISLTIAPNPTRGQVYIDSNHPIQQILIINSSGKRILTAEVNETKSIELNLSKLPAGLYLFQFLGKGWNETRRVIVN